MNFQYGDVKSSFKMYPKISERNLVSLSIGAGSFVLFYSLWQYYTAPHYLESDVQRGAPISTAAASSIALSKHSGESDRDHKLLLETLTQPRIYTERKVL